MDGSDIGRYWENNDGDMVPIATLINTQPLLGLTDRATTCMAVRPSRACALVQLPVPHKSDGRSGR